VSVTQISRLLLSTRDKQPERDHHPRPQHEHRQTAIERELQRCGVQVNHIAAGKAPLVPVSLHRVHAVTKKWMNGDPRETYARYLHTQR